MCDQHTSNGTPCCGSCVRRGRAPRQWIYQNVTPWRIQACFTGDGELAPRCTCDDGSPCDECTAHVLSIPALGEITVPHEDAQHLNTLNLRRLGQIGLRPAPSEFLTSLPRAIAIFGWLVVGLVLGAYALFFGGASAVPWAWFVAAVAFVPVVALIVATVREIHLYRCFSRYRASLKSAGKSLEGVERGSRVCTFIDGIPRQAAEVTVGILAVVVAVVGLRDRMPA